MSLPAWLLVHEVAVEPFTGSGAYGDTYGASFTLPCFAEGSRKLVRSSTGEQVLSTLTLYAAPGQAAKVPAGSRVTWQGTTTTVIGSMDHDGGNLGTPDHTEVVCE